MYALLKLIGKSTLVALGIAMIAATLTEVASIASVYFFLKTLSPEFEVPPLLEQSLSMLGLSVGTWEAGIIACCMVSAGLFAKSASLRTQCTAVENLRATLANLTLYGVLSSSKVIESVSDAAKSVSSEVDFVIERTAWPMMNIASYSLTFVSILAYLLYTNITTTAVLFLMIFIFYALIMLVSTKQIREISRTRSSADAQRQGIALDAIRARDEIRVYDTFRFLLLHHKVSAQEHAMSLRDTSLWSQVPRYFVESILFISCIVAALYMTQHSSLDSTLLFSTLGLYAFSGYKLIPCLQTIYQNTTLIRSSQSNGLSPLNLVELNNVVGTLEVPNSTRRRGTAVQTLVLSPLDSNCKFDRTIIVEKGNWIAVTGPTGAGKTTFLLREILRLYSPASTEMKLHDPQQNKIASWTTAYVPQTPVVIHGSLRDNLVFGRTLDADDDTIKRLLIDFGLANVLSKCGNDLDAAVLVKNVTLSGGQSQLLALVRAILIEPDILVLDEFTSALDPGTEDAILKKLKCYTRNCFVFFVSHRAAPIACATHFIPIQERH